MSLISGIRKRVLNLIAQFYYKLNTVFFNQSEIVFILLGESKAFGNITAVAQVLKQKNISYIVVDGTFTWENIRIISRASVLCIDQTNQLTSRLKLTKRTRTVQLWHAGGAFKRVAYDAWDGTDFDLNRITRVHGNTDYLIVSDEKLVELLSSAFRLKPSHVLPLGLARSDLFFNIQDKIHENKNLIVFAPTFRTTKAGYRYLDYSKDEILALHSEAKKHGFELALRLHPSLKSFHIDGIPNISEEDLYSCLRKTSILITDFSSIIFDYSLFDGRIFWVLKNIDSYERERGLYFDPSMVYPEYSGYSIESLIPKIFSSNSPINTPSLRKSFMGGCDGRSCDRIAKFLINLNSTGDQ